MCCTCMQVQGYVRGASRAGVFLTLERGLEARVRLANLSEGYVEDPVTAFPAGKHVQGWVASLADNRWVHASPPPRLSDCDA